MKFEHSAISVFLVVCAHFKSPAQTSGIEIVDSTRIIFNCDTLNAIDRDGRPDGKWMEWSSKVEHVKSTIDHIQDDKGQTHVAISTQRYYPRMVHEYKIEAIGAYNHGVRRGNWLSYGSNGTLQWIRTYDESGKLMCAIRLSPEGLLELAAMRDTTDHTGLLKVLRFDKIGEVSERDRIEAFILEK